MKNIALALVLSLSTLATGCGASATFHASSTLVVESSAPESPGSVCDRMPAHRTRRVHTPIVVDGVSYYCF